MIRTALDITEGTGQIYKILFPSQGVRQRPTGAWIPSQLKVYARHSFSPPLQWLMSPHVPTMTHVFTRIILVNPHHSPAT